MNDLNAVKDRLNNIGWTRTIHYAQHLGTWYPDATLADEIRELEVCLGGSTSGLSDVATKLLNDSYRQHWTTNR